MCVKVLAVGCWFETLLVKLKKLSALSPISLLFSVFTGSWILLNYFFFSFKYRLGRVIRFFSSLNRYSTWIIGFWKKHTWILLTTGFGFTRWDSGRSDPVGLDELENRWTALVMCITLRTYHSEPNTSYLFFVFVFFMNEFLWYWFLFNCTSWFGMNVNIIGSWGKKKRICEWKIERNMVVNCMPWNNSFYLAKAWWLFLVSFIIRWLVHVQMKNVKARNLRKETLIKESRKGRQS